MTEGVEQTGHADRDVSVTAWVVIVVAAVAVALLIAWARREPGFDDRVPDPPETAAAAPFEVEVGHE